MSDWFGASTEGLLQVASSTLALYVTVVVALRVAGRRTVSQMSAFDFVVTIAIGSLVASTVLTPDPSYLRGVVAVSTLLLAQQIVALIRQRVPWSRRILDFEPQALYSEGKLRLRDSPLTAQVTEAEIHSKLRRAGVDSLDEVRVVILEPDGRMSVLRHDSQRTEVSDLWRP